MSDWKNILKTFYSDKRINDMYKELVEECKEWAKDVGANMGSSNDINTINCRLAEIQKNIKGEEVDLVKQFIKLYELTENDFDIQKLGDELYEALKWREDNE